MPKGTKSGSPKIPKGRKQGLHQGGSDRGGQYSPARGNVYLQSPVPTQEGELTRIGEELLEEVNKFKQIEEAFHGSEKKVQFLSQKLIQASAVLRELDDRFQNTYKDLTKAKAMTLALLHDLRNPLAVINSCAQLCLEDKNLAPELGKNIRMIKESSQSANENIKIFLNLMKEQFSERKPVDLNDILIRTWEMARLQNAPCHVSFKSKLQEDLPMVMGNSEQLERVFINLFVNAIQAVCNLGKVTVKSFFLPSQQMVEVDVMDDGPGISEQYRDKVFAPFFTTREEGTGLGLHICQTIIQEHQGSIAIKEENDHGTTICVRVPCSSE